MLAGGTNGTHKATAVAPTNRSANGAHAPGSAPSTFFGHDREEVTRILIQALSDMGYQDAAESVSQDSGYKLESPTVSAFRSAILGGSWAEAEVLLDGAVIQGQTGGRDGDDSGGDGNGLVLAAGSETTSMKFCIREQKFLELLEGRATQFALHIMQNQLTPLTRDLSKIRHLASLLMCQTADEVKLKASWDGAGGQSRRKLLSELSSKFIFFPSERTLLYSCVPFLECISPSVMLPENRLAILLEQVKQSQINTCLYHTAAGSPSLYSDHSCDRNNFPNQMVLELDDMMGEIWEVQFSHDGSRLAACGAGDDVLIWETKTFNFLTALSIPAQNDHEGGVASIAWSPDDSMIVTCSMDNFARLWNTKVRTPYSGYHVVISADDCHTRLAHYSRN